VLAGVEVKGVGVEGCLGGKRQNPRYADRCDNWKRTELKAMGREKKPDTPISIVY